MAFSKADQYVPTSIGRVTITVSIDIPFINSDGNIVTRNEASYDVEILDQNGNRMRDKNDCGNLIPQLSDSEKNQIITFMQAQKDKAIAGFLQ